MQLLAATMNGYAYALGHRAERRRWRERSRGFRPADPTPEANYDEVLRNRSVAPTIDIDMAETFVAARSACRGRPDRSGFRTWHDD